MKLNFKFNPIKVGAYLGGAGIGAGLTWLGFKFMEKKGKNPEQAIQNRIEENKKGVCGSWSAEDFDRELGLPSNMEVLNKPEGVEDEGEVKEEKSDDESEPPPAEPIRIVKASEPVMIDSSLFSDSENEGYIHCYMTFYQEDNILVNNEHNNPEPKPFIAIGTDNWNLLESRSLTPEDGMLFVRNESFGKDQIKIDYCIEIKNESYTRDVLHYDYE